MVTPRKSGALSNKDRAWIIQNINKMTVQEMSDKIGKNVAVIEGAIKTHSSVPDAEGQAARWQLKKSVHWKTLKQQFTEEELNKIEDLYVMFIEQFDDDDIVGSEIIQILDVLKLEIMKDRNLKGKMSMGDNVGENQKIIDSLISSVDGDWNALSTEDQRTIMELKKGIEASKDAVARRTIEYLDIQKQCNTLTDKLMGSRHQRVTEILNKKVSFLNIVVDLQKKDKQVADSRMLQLHNLGTEKEYERLIQPHKYADDLMDNPILCAETIEELNKKENEEFNKENNGQESERDIPIS